MSDEPINPEEEEKNAITRIGMSHDGKLMHRYLRRILEGCRVIDDSGALQRATGMRIVARDLMVIMDKGAESGRSNSASPATPVLQRGGQIIDARRNHGINRRVHADPNVDRFLETGGNPDTGAKPS